MSSLRAVLFAKTDAAQVTSHGSDALRLQLRQLQAALVELAAQGETLRRDQVEYEKALMRSADELRIATTAFDAQNATVVTDPQGMILRVNAAFILASGYSAHEVVGKSVTLLESGRHDACFYDTVWQLLKSHGAWQGEVWTKSRSGSEGVVLLNIKSVASPVLGVTHYVGNFSDMSMIKEAEALMHRLAYYDPLTHLPNRRMLRDRLTQALAGSERSGCFGVLFRVKVDNFAELIDTAEFELGDLLLQELARSLQALVLEADTVARSGDAEFVVLLQDLANSEHDALVRAQIMGAKLQAVVPNTVSLKGNGCASSLSIGGVVFQANNTVEVLLTQADLALQQVKSAGHNSLQFFDPSMQAALDLRSTLEAELAKALHYRQFRLYYQPQVDRTLQVIGVEALIRWQHPLRGLVSPDEFIPMAEDTGLILPIGLWVLQNACKQIRGWQDQPRLQALQVAVNVSARQFGLVNFVELVQAALADSGANPARLKLELTESLVLENVSDVIEKMHALRRLGVSFSMDDFGTVYSSLAYLAKLPIDQLKIDKSFVENIPGKKSHETITRTIISMGQGLGIDVIAEGVETEAQREFLECHGCHAYQGYLFSRPLPLVQLEAYVKQLASSHLTKVHHEGQ